MSFVDWIKQKSGDDSMKYVLAGGLVLVIVIAMWGTISSMFGGRPEASADVFYYDLEKEQSYELTKKQLKEHGVSINEGGSGEMYNGQPLYWSPLTNEYTGVPMIKCPNCEELYRRPEYANPPQQTAVCPHCDTNLRDYERKKYLESK
jgi:hypothetical protein